MLLAPQQMAAPFSRRPQAWYLPALICVKGTSGGGEVGGVCAGVCCVTGVGMATLGGEGVVVGAGDGVGCAAIGGIAVDGDAGAEGKPDCGVYGTWVGGAGVATLVAKGAGWGAGTGWEQASRARQIAAQRAAVLGVYPFCICLNKSAAGAAMAARLGNAGITPYLNIRVARGRLYLSWLGALNFWQGSRCGYFCRKAIKEPLGGWQGYSFRFMFVCHRAPSGVNWPVWMRCMG